MQVAQNVITSLKKYNKKVFFLQICVVFFLHVVIKNLNEKKNLGIFESHSKIGQLENIGQLEIGQLEIGQLVFAEKWPEKLKSTHFFC